MDYKQRYQNRLQKKGNDSIESLKYTTKQTMNKLFDRSPSFVNILLNDKDEDINIIETKHSTDQEDMEIIFRPDTVINLGDVVNIDSINYLIVSLKDNDLYPTASIQKCNTTIKWQDNSLEIHEYPCIITNESYGSYNTINDSQQVLLPQGRLTVIIPDNEYTKKISRYKRLIFFDEVWKTTFIDKTENGLIRLTIEEDQVSDNDRVDLRLANYKENVYSLEINSTTIDLQETETFQIDAKAYKNGVIDSNAEIVYQSSDNTIATVDSNGLITAIERGLVTIDVSYQGIDKTINIEVTGIVENNYSGEIIGTNEVPQWTEETYTINWLNNGRPYDSIISNATIDDEAYATIKNINHHNNTIVIESTFNVGTFVLTVTNTASATIQKTINVISGF